MLTQVYISQLVTIEEATLTISPGTTVITGETGTGKSILLDAIELGLGGRASENLIRSGQEKADITLCFDIRLLAQAKAWLKQYDLAQDADECIIRRIISKDGRSRSFINGIPTTLQPLRELRELLVNIHGQFEHHALLASEKQRDILDRYAKHTQLVDQVKALSAEWHSLQQQFIALTKLSEEKQFRSELLSFQLRELEELQLTPDEFRALDLEHKQLAHAGDLLEHMNAALDHLSQHDAYNARSLITQALHSLETIQSINPKATTWTDQLKTMLIQLTDVETELQRYLESTELDPARLTWIEQRLSRLFELARKHKVSPEALYAFQCELRSELNQLEHNQEHMAALASQLQAIEKNYNESAKQLSLSRMKAGKQLAKEITSAIHELALPHGDFQIQFDQEHQAKLSPSGLEKILFHIKTNLGQPMQPLAKIVSGGELSRISLAIHIATAEQHVTPTLIFDEVDVGISGATAERVGKLLRRLGKTHQVLCVTHLPQVASQGHHHIRVEKIIQHNTTYTQIQSLSCDEKTHEIARLLGGVEITKNTLAHAREMLEKVLL